MSGRHRRVAVRGALTAGLVAASSLAAAATFAATDPGAPKAGTPQALRCYGAASRDPEHPCVNRRLRLLVSPTPTQALLAPYATCGELPRVGILASCRFGEGAQFARDEIALVGDSHAGHWRAAVREVARARRWRGTSMTRSGCPFIHAALLLPQPARAQCVRWNAAVIAWFRHHPEVHTVFVSERARVPVDVPPGRSALAARVAGYSAAWRALPPSVRHVIVLRDVPLRPLPTLDCVENAIARRLPAGSTCAVPRAIVLHLDGAAVTARRLHAARYQVIDLTRYFCGPHVCFPVVGGALVGKDQNHMTTAFATSLWPYVLRRANQLLPKPACPKRKPKPKPKPKPAVRPAPGAPGISRRRSFQSAAASANPPSTSSPPTWCTPARVTTDR